MKMKEYTLLKVMVLFMLFSMIMSCGNDEQIGDGNMNVMVTAKASLGAVTTRVSYSDAYTSDNSLANITMAWENNDVINALEGTSACTFTTTQSGTTEATFTSSDAKTPTSETEWKAVLGDGAKVSGSTITCNFDGQDGTLSNLKNYDYMVANSAGIKPSFNFTTGNRLTYFLRLKLPKGISSVEFCTGAWTITSDAITVPVASTNTVSRLELKSKSTAGQIVYLAVPAIDYTKVGLIITIFSGTQSQGKVVSKDFSALGGHVGNYDMSSLVLIDCPVVSYYLKDECYHADYADLDTYGKWARFNVGASVSPSTAVECYGNLYQWGRTEPSSTYSWDTYLCKQTDCGGACDPIYVTGFFSSGIQGTKYDVARVKWGRAWRMPTKEEFDMLLSFPKASSEGYGYKKTWQETHVINSEISVKGLSFVMAYMNKYAYYIPDSLFLPAAGWKDLTSSNTGSMGCYWVGLKYNNQQAHYYRFDKDLSASTDNIVPRDSYDNRYCGFSVRPIYAE